MIQQALLQKQANELLWKSGFLADGEKKSNLSKKNRNQRFFERRIITTPMGNKTR